MKTLLVIDDDDTILALFKAFLGRAGYTVSTASTGRQGLAEFQIHRHDAVVCDLRMPEMGGLEVLAEVKALAPLTPFVVMSGTADISQAVEALQQGAWDFLIKPFASLEIIPPVLDRMAERAALLLQHQQYQTRLETEIAQRTAELTRQLHEKDLLLAEVHHRVKNNLQIILILLGLQQEHSSDPKVVEVLTESQNRLHTLALIQEEVNDPENTASIDSLPYFTNLVHHSLMVFGLTSSVDLRLDISPLAISPGVAFTYGLVVNELMTALANHLVVGKGRFRLKFSFRPAGAGHEIQLMESAKALETWNPGPDSLYVGYTLLKALVQQGGGDIHYSRQTADRITITFP